MVLSSEIEEGVDDLDKGKTMQKAVRAFGCNGTSNGAFDSGSGGIDVADPVHTFRAKFTKAHKGAAKGTIIDVPDDYSRTGEDHDLEKETATAEMMMMMMTLKEVRPTVVRGLALQT